MTIYRIDLSWGERIYMDADLSQASAPICTYDPKTGEGRSTQWQTADARHDTYAAAELLLDTYGSDFYLPGDADIDTRETVTWTENWQKHERVFLESEEEEEDACQALLDDLRARGINPYYERELLYDGKTEGEILESVIVRVTPIED